MATTVADSIIADVVKCAAQANECKAKCSQSPKPDQSLVTEMLRNATIVVYALAILERMGLKNTFEMNPNDHALIDKIVVNGKTIYEREGD